MTGANSSGTGYLIIAHGELAFEMLRTLEFITGQKSGFKAVAIDHAVDMDKAREIITSAIDEIMTDKGVIVLTDLFGGTPSNLAISLLEAGRVEVIAGINLPMLIRLAGARKAMDVTAAVRAARDAGKSYITIASEFLSADACLKKKAAS